MNRHASRDQMIQVVEELRKQIPGIVIRTSLIVGFPGETDDDFDELLDFIRIVKPERAGVFKFSREEGTPAYDMPDQVPGEVADMRWKMTMEVLREISRKYGQSRVGSLVRAIVDGPSDESELVVEARSFAEAPDVDGKIYIGVPRCGREIRRCQDRRCKRLRPCWKLGIMPPPHAPESPLLAGRGARLA